MSETSTATPARDREHTVHLIDGNSFTVVAGDDEEAVLRAGDIAGRDLAHLVLEVVEDPDDG